MNSILSPSRTAREFHSSRCKARPLCSINSVAGWRFNSRTSAAIVVTAATERDSPFKIIIIAPSARRPNLSKPAPPRSDARSLRFPAANADHQSELTGGDVRLARRNFRRHNPAADGAMDFLPALTGVTARLGMTAGAHHRYPDLDEQIAQRSRLTRAQNDPDLRECNAQRAHQLNQIAIAHRKMRAKFAGRWTKTRNTYGEGRFPAAFKQIFDMRGQRDRFLAPRSQPKKRANSNATKTGVVAALGTGQAPAKILFWSGQMQLIINRAVICFLVNDETFRAPFNNRNVFLRFHRSDFDRDR